MGLTAVARELLEKLSRTAGARMAQIATTADDAMSPELAERLRRVDVILRRQNLSDFAGPERRLKNVHESGRTASAAGGARAKEVRSKYEPYLLGGTDVNYGYLTEDPSAAFRIPLSTRYPDKGPTYLRSDSPLSQYGSYGLRLRPEARERVSLMFGDSLDTSRGPYLAEDIANPTSPYQDVASPRSPLRQWAMDYNAYRERMAAELKTAGPDEAWQGLDAYIEKRGGPETFREFVQRQLGDAPPLVGGMPEGYFPRLVARPLNAPDWKPLLPSEKHLLEPEYMDNVLRRDGVGGLQAYYEAQVHGGVTPKDIAAVHDFNVHGSSALEKRLRKLGIDYVPPPADNVGALIERYGLGTYGDLVDKLGPDVLSGGSRYDRRAGPLRKYDLKFQESELPKLRNFARGGLVR